MACVAAVTAADDGAVAVIKGVVDSLGKPGLEITYDGPYMDRDTGTFRYPVSEIKAGADPLSSAALLFGATATRCGGLLPDEMPFNIVQKIVRGVLPVGWWPDYADDDFRKQFQDTWYGTNEQAALPEFMRSRKSAPPADESPVGEDDAAVDASKET